MDNPLSGARALHWDSPIVVVGASLAGPAAAAFLRAAGFRNVKVLEAAAKSFSRAGGVIRLGRVSLNALERIGIPTADIVPWLSDEIIDITLSDRAEVARLRVPAPGGNTTWTLLHTALASRLPGGTIEYGKAVTGIVPGDGGDGGLVLAGGRIERASLIVFADGRRSVGRRLLDPRRRLQYAGSTMFRGQAESGDPAVTGFFRYELGVGAQLYLAPVNTPAGPGLDWTLGVSMPERDFRAKFGASPTVRTFVMPGQLSEAADRTLESAADDLLPRELASVIHGTSRRSALPLVEIDQPDRMRFDIGGTSALLIGDALAPVHPATARGANLGLGEAAGLAAALSTHVREGIPLAAALTPWEREWLGRVAQTLAGSGSLSSAHDSLSAQNRVHTGAILEKRGSMRVPEVSATLLAIVAAAVSAVAVVGALRLRASGGRGADAARTRKPRFRGVLHTGAAVAAPAAGYHLVASAPDAEARLAAVLYSGAIVLMLATSATYHVVAWEVDVERVLMRIDHANIFTVIAASFTPFALLNHPAWHNSPLLSVWLCATVGMITKLLAPSWPAWLCALIYAGFGWAPIVEIVSLTPTIGVGAITLMIAAGVTYTAGSVVYAFRMLNMWPNTFGFHEFWHLLVVVATGMQWWVIADAVIPRL